MFPLSPYNAYATSIAGELYQRAWRRGQLNKLWSVLTRQPHRLLNLADVEATQKISSRSYAGIRTVPICQIQGSESRYNEFDLDFYPLQQRTKERWLRLAAAWYQGETIPPVELIQVGHVYFVRDGHHRLSIVRMLGQQAIEAEVTVWQVTELPVERYNPEVSAYSPGSAIVQPNLLCAREQPC